jgi:Protein of unknown function (DUF2726)
LRKVANPFLNRYEEVTYEKLRAVCEPQNAHVFPKVRLADILPIDNSGLSNQDFGFALKSHADFSVIDSEQKIQFCVEFDGLSHNEPKQIRRDKQKNSLFNFFKVPLLRINSKYLEPKYRGLDLLTYFVEVWFLDRAFCEAQENGDIPFDEIFDPAFIIHDDKQNFPYWLSLEQQVCIKKLADEKKIAHSCPSSWVGIDSNDNYRCLTWILVNPDTAVYVETCMRSQRFHAVIPSDLLPMIAVCDLYEELQRVLSCEIKGYSNLALKQKVDFYRQNYKLCQFAGLEIV